MVGRRRENYKKQEKKKDNEKNGRARARGHYAAWHLSISVQGFLRIIYLNKAFHIFIIRF